MAAKVARISRIACCTGAMYVVTHLVVSVVAPWWALCSYFRPASMPALKARFGRILLGITNKRVCVSGLENAEPGRRYLIVANYPSFHAGFVLMMLFPQASIVVHPFPSKVPLLNDVLKRSGCMYAHRNGFRQTTRAMRAILRMSEVSSIVLLPEGKRTHNGKIGEFKRGFVYVLRHSSLDLLPVTLNGFYTFKPANRPYADADAELKVIVHKPITQAAIRSLDDRELRKMVVSSIADAYIP